MGLGPNAVPLPLGKQSIRPDMYIARFSLAPSLPPWAVMVTTPARWTFQILAGSRIPTIPKGDEKNDEKGCVSVGAGQETMNKTMAGGCHGYGTGPR